MTTFYLIRHGNCGLLGKSLAGWLEDVHLDQRGREQAASLAAVISRCPVEHLFSSPLARAVETAEAISRRRGIGVGVLEKLGEIRFGRWTGETFENLYRLPEWRTYNSFRSGTRIPEGEMLIESQSRIVTEMDRLRTEFPGSWIALVTHADIIKAAIAHYAGVPLDLIARIEIAPASISVVRIGPYGPCILCTNHTGDIRDILNG